MTIVTTSIDLVFKGAGYTSTTSPSKNISLMFKKDNQI